MNISNGIDLLLRIHYLISACEGEPEESIGQCVFFEPEQGYTESLRILETLYVVLDADVFPNIAVVHQVLVKIFEVSFDFITSEALEFS